VLCSLQKVKNPYGCHSLTPTPCYISILSFFYADALGRRKFVLGQSVGGFTGEGRATTTAVTNFATLFRRQKQLFLFVALMRFSAA
jgi:hypothetical protein